MASKKRKSTAKAKAPVNSDRGLLFAVSGLALLGVVAVYSAITFLAETKAGGATGSFLFRHLAYTGAALTVMVAASQIDYHKLVRWAMPALGITIGLLVFVQLAGVVSGGATRWLRIGSFTLQPSEFARVALLLHVAFLLAKKQAYIADFKFGFMPLLFWILPVTVLIGAQDLSTAALLFATCTALCFVARVRVLHLSGLFAVLAGLAVMLLLVSPNRMQRVEAWIGKDLSAQTDQAEVMSDQAEGYQARQAKIAIATGGLTGRGPGKSIQRDFLPAPYNDFIFAIVAEEYGLIGAGVLLAAFFFLLYRGFLTVAQRAPDPLGLFLGVGITTTIVLYGLVNAGVAVGLLPVTGLPLPFVSYGGTALIANGALMGVLLNVSKHR
ncbi:MAG: putative peptidoglycan glycosyltransferase FtsW [Bacteroidota bacterium]